MAIDVIAFTELIVLLNEYPPKSKAQLREATGISVGAIIKWMKVFRRRDLIYIAEYKKDSAGKQWTAYWAWGYKHMDDVIKPSKIPSAILCQKYRNKLKNQKRLEALKEGIDIL